MDRDEEAKLAEQANEKVQQQMKQKEAGKLEEAIESMHKEHPDAILLTQTSAVPFGWAIREAWKKAYPGETVPKMLTIDVGQLKYSKLQVDLSLNESEFWRTRELLSKDPEFHREVRYLEDKIQRYSIKKFVVFDESTRMTGQTDYRRQHPMATLFLVEQVVAKAHEDLKGSFESGRIYGVEDWDRGRYLLDEKPVPPYAKATFIDKREDYRHAKLPKEWNPKIKRTIEDMKEVGRKIGEDIHRKRDARKKTLLGGVTMILALGFGAAYNSYTGFATRSSVFSPEGSYVLLLMFVASCIFALSAVYLKRKL